MQAIRLPALKGRNNIDDLFARGRRFSGRKATVIATGPLGIARNKLPQCGVSISKRYAKKAVVRNRVKRLIRQSLRLYFARRYATDIMPEKLMVMWRHAPRHPGLIRLSDVSPELELLMNKAIAYMKKQSGTANADMENK